jgi:hypothetical protein
MKRIGNYQEPFTIYTILGHPIEKNLKNGRIAYHSTDPSVINYPWEHP